MAGGVRGLVAIKDRQKDAAMTDIFDDAPKLTEESMKINLRAEAALAEIKPRIDGGGVGWCDDCTTCPSREFINADCDSCIKYEHKCLVDGNSVTDDSVCPPHTARMAALLRSISIAHPDEPVAEFQHNIDDLLGGE